MSAGRSMDHALRIVMELDLLRALCNRRIPAVQRGGICNTLSQYKFSDAEDRVVFESVCTLLGRGSLSPEELAVNLINRGFPDTDMERYFVAEPPGILEMQDIAGKLMG